MAVVVAFVCSDPFGRPRTVARSGTAARRSDQLLSFSPKSAERRLVSSAQLRLPSQTNKAVNPIRPSSAGVQTRMNHNDRGVICQNRIAPSTRIFSSLEIKFQGDCGKFLSDFYQRALSGQTWTLCELPTVDNVILP